MSLVTTLEHAEKRSPGLELAKYSAFLLMLVDHTNSYLLAGEHEWMWHAGRLVFPVFALVLGLGLSRRSADLRSVLVRLLCLAVLAELAAWPLVAAGVRPSFLNVCWTLFAGTCLVQADRSSGWWVAAWAAVAAAASWGAEYGFLGAALVWAGARGSRVWVYALLGVLALWQGSPVPLLALGCVTWADREALGLDVRTWRSAFGVAYVAQFLAFSALM